MKLFLAGGESEQFARTIRAAGHPWLLMSYFGAKLEKNYEMRRLIMELQSKGMEYIMDSGVFSMMFGSEKHRIFSRKDLRDYTQRYTAVMKEMEFAGDIVEMDIHKIAPMAEVRWARKHFEKHWPIERTIYVWHQEEGRKNWKPLAKRYPYIGIGIPELRKILGKSRPKLAHCVARMIGEAKDANPAVKIHLLGCSDLDLIDQPGWHSCDSITWGVAGRFGEGCYWTGTEIQRAPLDSKPFKRWIEKNGQVLRVRLQEVATRLDNPTRLRYYMVNGCSAIAFREMIKMIRAKHGITEPLQNLWA